tara:strand:- start:850 stop:1020 length:171 start_codon:yes stop_codon:yes gene_type:complete
MTKNEKITIAIAAQINSGKSVKEAFDAVLGEGAYIKMAGELYDALNAKAAASSIKH